MNNRTFNHIRNIKCPYEFEERDTVEGKRFIKKNTLHKCRQTLRRDNYYEY